MQRKQHKKLGFLVLVIIVYLSLPTFGNLPKRINRIINDPSQSKVAYGIHIIKANNSEIIYSFYGDEPLIPASNMKIITTAAALEYLGADYEFITKIVLSGDTLVVIGSGDPLFGYEQDLEEQNRKHGGIFSVITEKLNRFGYIRIKDIIVDSNIFDDQRAHPNWPANDLNKWYACEVSGINYNGNCIEITAENHNGNIRLMMEPSTGFIKMTNKVKPSSKSNTIGSLRTSTENNIIVIGTCKNKIGPIKVAIERPAAFFGYLLAEKLGNAGIDIEGKLIEKKFTIEETVKPVFVHRTLLKDVLAHCNKDSFGLAAESLVKIIAAEKNPYGGNGSWKAGTVLISQYLLKAGVNKNEFNIDDGSGLSRHNKLSANAITKVLLDVYQSNNWNVYKESLAVGGADGTIAKYFKEEKYKERILGKTGYIRGVKSFSGICITDNEEYIFSILANNTNGGTRTAINNIAKAIIDEYN